MIENNNVAAAVLIEPAVEAKSTIILLLTPEAADAIRNSLQLGHVNNGGYTWIENRDLADLDDTLAEALAECV
jgi:hypothetical protein